MTADPTPTTVDVAGGWPRVYVLFPGTARAALAFYHRVFGGELVVHTFEEFGRDDGPADAVAHGELRGPVTLFGADTGPGEDSARMTGMMLSILGTDEARLRGWFDALADDGQVLDALTLRPWGGIDGQLLDRHGLRWLIGIEGAGA
ncbi:VOC family protein [Tersicoccus solisilvae]|uniref:VOC family protein n=1 Tax=Tersicoccus solisilvae TaxID=1882339 RepID=A0ABQ1NUT7_9MICC|nr:VOC family protein [Tersicoccus solisilvae]GGC80566.1 VOC family protein [Tersicoccus solisilvae]